MIKRRSIAESIRFASNPGSRLKQKKHGVVNPDGTISLVDDEIIDLQEMYDAEYPSTTIENILRNCVPGTDFSDPGNGFLDVTNAPKTLAEFMQLQIDQKYKFDSLPVEIKQKFDNDLNKFMMSAGTDEWFDKLGIVLTKEEIKEEVKTDES